MLRHLYANSHVCRITHSFPYFATLYLAMSVVHKVQNSCLLLATWTHAARHGSNICVCTCACAWDGVCVLLQVRATMHWTKDDHTNKVSQLLRLGTEAHQGASPQPPPQPDPTDSQQQTPHTPSEGQQPQSPPPLQQQTHSPERARSGRTSASPQRSLARAGSSRKSIRHQDSSIKPSHVMVSVSCVCT